MNLKDFLLSLLTALLFVPTASQANEKVYTLEDVPRPEASAFDEQTGLPTTISVNGEISRTVLRSGKVVGFLFAQLFQGVTYARDAAGVYLWVIRDSASRVISLTPISVHRTADVDFTLRYMLEDADSLEAIKRSITEHAKAERVAQKSYVESLKRPADQNAERSSFHSLKSAAGCQITCDYTRDTEINRCDEGLNTGNAVCDLTDGIPIAGPLFTLNCKTRIASQTRLCKNSVADRWRQCSMRCQGFVFNVE